MPLIGKLIRLNYVMSNQCTSVLICGMSCLDIDYIRTLQRSRASTGSNSSACPNSGYGSNSTSGVRGRGRSKFHNKRWMNHSKYGSSRQLYGSPKNQRQSRT